MTIQLIVARTASDGGKPGSRKVGDVVEAVPGGVEDLGASVCLPDWVVIAVPDLVSDALGTELRTKPAPELGAATDSAHWRWDLEGLPLVFREALAAEGRVDLSDPRDWATCAPQMTRHDGRAAPTGSARPRDLPREGATLEQLLAPRASEFELVVRARRDRRALKAALSDAEHEERKERIARGASDRLVARARKLQALSRAAELGEPAETSQAALEAERARLNALGVRRGRVREVGEEAAARGIVGRSERAARLTNGNPRLR